MAVVERGDFPSLSPKGLLGYHILKKVVEPHLLRTIG